MDVRLSSEQKALCDAAARVAEQLGPDTVVQLDDHERKLKGCPLAMTMVAHEREPHEIGFATRFCKTVKILKNGVHDQKKRYEGEALRDLAWGIIEAEMQSHVSRRLSDRLDGLSHGPEGSIDKLLMVWAEQTVGYAALAIGGAPHAGTDPTMFNTYLYSRSASVMGGTEQSQCNLIATRILGLPT